MSKITQNTCYFFPVVDNNVAVAVVVEVSIVAAADLRSFDLSAADTTRQSRQLGQAC